MHDRREVENVVIKFIKHPFSKLSTDYLVYLAGRQDLRLLVVIWSYRRGSESEKLCRFRRWMGRTDFGNMEGCSSCFSSLLVT